MNTRTIAISNIIKTLSGQKMIHSWQAPNGTKIEVELFRTNKFMGPEDDGYRPSQVSVNGVAAWKFQTSGIRPYAELIEVDGEPCPIIVGLNSRYVMSVLPTEDFEKATTILVGGVTKLTGGSTIERLLDLKIAIAEGFGLEPNFSPNEQILMQERIEAARTARFAQKQGQAPTVNIKREKQQAARAAFKDELLKRPAKLAYLANGEIRNGLPVTEAEIERLIGDRHYIVTDEKGAAIRYFFLTKSKNRSGEKEVFDKKPQVMKQAETNSLLQAERMILVNIGGASTEVPLYRNASIVSIVRRDWNEPVSVAYPECKQGQETGRICVVSASKAGCKDIMVLQPKPSTKEELLAA